MMNNFTHYRLKVMKATIVIMNMSGTAERKAYKILEDFQ